MNLAALANYPTIAKRAKGISFNLEDEWVAIIHNERISPLGKAHGDGRAPHDVIEAGNALRHRVDGAYSSPTHFFFDGATMG